MKSDDLVAVITLRKTAQRLGLTEQLEEILGYIEVNQRELDALEAEDFTAEELQKLDESLQELEQENPEVAQAAKELEEIQQSILDRSKDGLERWFAKLTTEVSGGTSTTRFGNEVGTL